MAVQPTTHAQQKTWPHGVAAGARRGARHNEQRGAPGAGGGDQKAENGPPGRGGSKGKETSMFRATMPSPPLASPVSEPAADTTRDAWRPCGASECAPPCVAAATPPAVTPLRASRARRAAAAASPAARRAIPAPATAHWRSSSTPSAA